MFLLVLAARAVLKLKQIHKKKKRKTFKWCIETSEDFCAAHSCSEACWCEGRRTVALRLHCISRMAPSSSSSSSSSPSSPPGGRPLTQPISHAPTLLPLSSSSSSSPLFITTPQCYKYRRLLGNNLIWREKSNYETFLPSLRRRRTHTHSKSRCLSSVVGLSSWLQSHGSLSSAWKSSHMVCWEGHTLPNGRGEWSPPSCLLLHPIIRGKKKKKRL